MKIIKEKRMLKLLEKAGFCMWEDEPWKPEGATVCWDCNYDKEIRKYTKLVVKEVITQFAKSVEAKLREQPTWHCPLKKPDCKENCGSYGCGN